jgi:hypothetical protein
MSVEYTKGLHELSDGLWAYLQPRGQWGYSNAGLVAGDGDSLLVDTLKENIDFAGWAFGDFDFTEITGRAPDETFNDELTLSVGGREVVVRDLGPAHTKSDSIVLVPSARAVFTGDLVFNRGTPIAWAGPISNWLTARSRPRSLASAPDPILMWEKMGEYRRQRVR